MKGSHESRRGSISCSWQSSWMAQVSWSRPPGHLLWPLLLKEMLSRTICLETHRGGPSGQGLGPGLSHQERLRRVHQQDPRWVCRPQARCLWLRRGAWEPAPWTGASQSWGGQRRGRTGRVEDEAGVAARGGTRPWVVISRGDWTSCLHRGLRQRGQ